MPLLLNQPLSLLREEEDFEPSGSADLECPPAHEPLADKLSEPTVHVRSVALEVKAREVLGRYRPELADRLHGLDVRRSDQASRVANAHVFGALASVPCLDVSSIV